MTPSLLPAPNPAPEGWLQGSVTPDGIITLFAALLAAVVVVVGYSFQKKQARKAAQAIIYGEAIRAVHDYLEAPYRVLRRDGSAEARMATTDHISDVQSRLEYYRTLLRVHAPTAVGNAYSELVSAARAEAGPQMTAAWRYRPTRSDREVPIKRGLNHPRSTIALDTTIRLMAKQKRAG